MIGVVIPCYKVTKHIISVLENIGPEVDLIFVVDDYCPDQSGQFVEAHSKDPRVCVVYNPENRGVGGATLAGYFAALSKDSKIIVKIDGDGQMDPKLIPRFIAPIQKGLADYVKGNRFFDLDTLSQMPRVRLFGNAVLSIITKLSTGYWNIMDPTNGYTAIHADALKMLQLGKVETRYFFESDMLFRLGICRAVVLDIPMKAVYADEESHMNVSRVALTFPLKHLKRATKRILYNYYLRDFNIGSCHLLLGTLMLTGGVFYGTIKYYHGQVTNTFASSGTVMLSSLPIILGFQLLIAFLQYDVSNIPKRPIQN